MNEGFKSINKCKFSEPFKKFSQYLELAKKKPNIVEPTAMCLSSVDERGFPSSRIVLLKSFDEKGFCFFCAKKLTEYKILKRKTKHFMHQR